VSSRDPAWSSFEGDPVGAPVVVARGPVVGALDGADVALGATVVIVGNTVGGMLGEAVVGSTGDAVGGGGAAEHTFLGGAEREVENKANELLAMKVGKVCVRQSTSQLTNEIYPALFPEQPQRSATISSILCPLAASSRTGI
jgi:hypothetical protein